MPDIFIAILVAFGFWSRQSKDQKIKTSNASWLRTFVYFVLLIMVGVFYYKSNQIPVIKHDINILGIRQATVDSTQNTIQDRASLQIINRFDNNSLFKHIFDYTKQTNSLGYTKTKENGGVNVILSLYNDSLTKFRVNLNEENEFYHHSNPLNENMYNHYYAVSMVSSRISSISPFQPYLKIHSFDKLLDLKGILDNDTIPAFYYSAALSSMYEAHKNNLFSDSAIYDYHDDNAICSVQHLWTKKNKKIKIYKKELPFDSNVLNSMDFFSAADLSQCTYVVGVMSECPLEEIYFNFDVPVEMLPSKYKPTQLDAYDICFKDSLMLEQIRNHILFLHVKMPTMQNLQLVRSLILTTLLTALLSLFLSNLYYALRRTIKWCKRHKSKSKSNFSFLRRLKKWEKSLHRTIYILLLLLLALTVQRCKDYFILIDAYDYDFFIYSILSLIFIIVVYYVVLFFIIKNKKISKIEDDSDDINDSDMMKYIVEKNTRDDKQEEERIYSEHIKEFADSIKDSIKVSESEKDSTEENKTDNI